MAAVLVILGETKREVAENLRTTDWPDCPSFLETLLLQNL